ncbi:MAG: TatD family hydrolase [Parvibaculales bacterium]
MFVDSHCHLDFPDFTEDREEVIKRAGDAKVSNMLSICTRLSDIERICKIADTYPHIYASIGVHPHEADKENNLTLEKLIGYSSQSKVIALGETGLDFYYENSPKEAQIQAFAVHIEAAKQTKLPLIVHTREAEQETCRQLEEQKGEISGVIHCFTGTKELADRALALGFYISVSGIVTFKNAQNLRDVLADIPLERLLIETDAPYLAPVPYRGKRNEPAFIRHTAQCLADSKHISLEDVARATTENFFSLFSRAK